MFRLGTAEIIVVIPREITTLLIFRERSQLASMTDVGITRITEMGLTGSLVTCIHPLVIGLIQIRLVEPGGRSRKIGFVFRQIDLHTPIGTGHPLIGGDIATGTSILLVGRIVIDGCTGGRHVTNDTKIKLNTTRSPRTSHGNIAEFHHMVVVDKGLPRCLVDGSPNLASHLRIERQADIVVLQLHGFPTLIYTLSRKAIKAEIGIIHIRRISSRIRIGEGIGLDGLNRFLHRCLLLCPQGNCRPGHTGNDH